MSEWQIDRICGRVKQHRYRRAQVSNTICELPREALVELEQQLSRAAGARVENHVVYELHQFGRDPVYIRFSDGTVTFARTIIKACY